MFHQPDCEMAMPDMGSPCNSLLTAAVTRSSLQRVVMPEGSSAIEAFAPLPGVEQSLDTNFGMVGKVTVTPRFCLNSVRMQMVLPEGSSAKEAFAPLPAVQQSLETKYIYLHIGAKPTTSA